MATLRTPGNRRLSLLFHRASEPIFLIDAANRLVYVNPSWERLTGHDAESVLGLECTPSGQSEEPGKERLVSSFCPPSEAFGTAPTATTTLIISATGERVWRRLEFWPLHTSSSRTLALVGFVRPVEAISSVPDAESLRLRNQLEALREMIMAAHRPVELIGTGPQHDRLNAQIQAAAILSGPLLIAGESGTGKRLVARIIHDRRWKKSRSLQLLDIPAFPPAVIQREFEALFSTAPSSESSTTGLHSEALGTVVLHEICQLPRDLQAQLETRLGGLATPCLIATTSADPELSRISHTLREDLYYRLTAQTINLPPLRNRLNDIPLLAQAFLEAVPKIQGQKLLGLASDALAVLGAYDWPGNLAELRRVVNFSAKRATGTQITVTDLPAEIRGHLGAAYNPPPMPPPVTPLDPTLENLERKLIEQALTHSRQNKSKAAELLEISRPRLYRRMKDLNIADLPEQDAKF